jgi:hypothetical protein
MSYEEKARDYANFGLQGLARQIVDLSTEDIYEFLTFPEEWGIIERRCSDFGLDPDHVKGWMIFMAAARAVKEGKNVS